MVKIREMLPATGYASPSPSEFVELAGIVRRECLWIDPFGDAEFARAFLAVGYSFRLADTDRSAMFYTHIDRCNDFLSSLDLPAVSGPAVLAAIVAHNDIPYRRHDGGKGQLLEVGLSRFGPGRTCSNAWRGLLRGEALKPPLPARVLPGGSSQNLASSFRVYPVT